MSKIDTPSSYNTSHFRLKHVLFIHQISISRWKIKQYGTITKNKTISYLNDEKIHRKNKKETPGLCENDLKKKKEIHSMYMGDSETKQWSKVTHLQRMMKKKERSRQRWIMKKIKRSRRRL